MAQEKKTTRAPKKSVKAASKQARPAVLAHGVGRRKNAVARVWLRSGSGVVTVNGKDVNSYFDTDLSRLDAVAAFRAVPVAAHHDADINVQGGGKAGQAGAVKLGISRALVDFDADLKSVLRKHGLLTVDSRVKERKKYGQRGARRKFQFVKR